MMRESFLGTLTRVDLGRNKTNLSADLSRSLCTDHIFYGKGDYKLPLKLENIKVEKSGQPSSPYDSNLGRFDRSGCANIVGASSHSW
jgi:hypothetical protein